MPIPVTKADMAKKAAALATEAETAYRGTAKDRVERCCTLTALADVWASIAAQST